ncbi:glycoside hydrolase protein [Diplodia corticola]|uniref:Glycoside hydrolase protein n=1 Tax=Diplodia corticola TaxID=236234 RepID=A0A1J9SKB9_9PEZI|nr:glycoside hydrolase protein [Diplodia corticola]OJD40188.1 glycoside hydrolase protein [Diplodia corticola]
MPGSYVPHEVLGLAIFVDCLSLVATILGLLLCFMLWNHGERVSYILMLSTCTTFGAIIGLIRHVDYTLNWRDIQIQRFQHEQHYSYSQSDVFRKADVGWRLVLSWISIFTYNVDALLVLFWSIALFIGTWDIRMKSSSRKIMSVAFKASAVILPIVMCVVCSSETIQQVPVAYLVLFNFIMATCLTSGSLLVIIVLLKYLQSRNLFTRFFPRSSSKSPSLGGGTVTSVATTRTQTGTDKWLIVRFSIIMICLLVFETAQIVYQIVNYERNRHDSSTTATSPDFSAEQAKIDVSQDIPGTLPSIIAFLIFGTTAPFRRKYAQAVKTVFCCTWTQRKKSRKDPIPWMMLQPRTEGQASCASFPEGMDLEGQDKPADGIQVRTEISTSSASSETTTARNTIDENCRPSIKDSVKRVSFGGTTLRSQEDPTSPPLAYSNPSSRRPSSPTRMHHRTLSPILRAGSQPGSPDAQIIGSWEWSSHNRQGSLPYGQQDSLPNSRRPSASLVRQPSITSVHSQRSWTSPPLPGRALPLLAEVDSAYNRPSGPTHKRIPSSQRSPRSSRDDDSLYQPSMSSPRLVDVPPVPRIPSPADWQRDSATTIGSIQMIADMPRGPVSPQATTMSTMQRASADEFRRPEHGGSERPGWFSKSTRASFETASAASNRPSAEGSMVPTTAARSGNTATNLASAPDLSMPGMSNRSDTIAARRQVQRSRSHHSRNGTLLSNSEMENLNLAGTPSRGSPASSVASPPSHQLPGGWI